MATAHGHQLGQHFAHDDSVPRAYPGPADNNGPMGEIRLVEVTERVLDLPALQALVDDPRAGAVVTFSGTVRDHRADEPLLCTIGV